MLDKPLTHRRARLQAPAATVLATLPAIGSLMVTAKHLGVTHERIGKVETVTIEDGWVVIAGAEHESRIELAAIAEIVVDRTSVMQDKAYPRLNLNRADGSYICGIVGFDGLEPFDAAIAAFGAGEALDEEPPATPGARGEVADDDAARRPFDGAIGDAAHVVVSFVRPGFSQTWRGVPEAVKPAMGFVNVMRADFHLHIKAGAIAGWIEDAGAVYATSPDGERIGLSVRR